MASPEETRSFDSLIAGAIDDARQGGASDAQMAILLEAQADGVLSAELTREAARTVVDCMNANGMAATFDETTEKDGTIYIGYVANRSGLDDATADSIYELCDTRNFFWVSYVYQVQPASIDTGDAYLDHQADVLRTCLEAAGESTDPDATGLDLAHQALELRIDSDGEVDCLDEADIGSF